MTETRSTFCRICEPNCALRAKFDDDGSVVIDRRNRAGFGAGAWVACYTGCLRRPEGGQAQELAYFTHRAVRGAAVFEALDYLELRFNPMKRNRGGERDDGDLRIEGPRSMSISPRAMFVSIGVTLALVAWAAPASSRTSLEIVTRSKPQPMALAP